MNYTQSEIIQYAFNIFSVSGLFYIASMNFYLFFSRLKFDKYYYNLFFSLTCFMLLTYIIVCGFGHEYDTFNLYTGISSGLLSLFFFVFTISNLYKPRKINIILSFIQMGLTICGFLVGIGTLIIFGTDFYNKNVDYFIIVLFMFVTLLNSINSIIIYLFSDKRNNILFFLGTFFLAIGFFITKIHFYINFYLFKDNYILISAAMFSFSLVITKKYNIEYVELLDLRKSLENLNKNLEQKIIDRTQELENSNKELSEAKKQIEDENRKRKDFYINFSHEIKTPLTLISNYLDMYFKKSKKDKELEVVDTNVKILRNHVVNLLDAEMLYNRKYRFNKEEIFNFSEMIGQKVILFKETAAKKKIKLLSSVEENIYLKADPFSIDKVVNNLINNAVKYTDEKGNINITLKSENGKAFFSVRDTGIGIPEKNKSHIFEAYYQIEREKFNYQGLGMGLYITKEILDNMGAEINVESEEGRGTEFRIIFKTHELLRDEIVKEDIDYGIPVFNNQVFHENKIIMKISQNNILVVEDNHGMLKFINNELEGRYNVITALNGKEALDKLEKYDLKPDLIISDIMMDKMDGVEFRRRILDIEKYQKIPFIFLTARNFNGEKEHIYRELKVDDYIIKPFTAPELNIKVDAMINRINVFREERNRFMKVAKDIVDSGIILADKDPEYNFFVKCKKYRINEMESKIIKLVVESRPTKEIADILKVTDSSVKKYITRIMKKTGFQSRLEIGRYFSNETNANV
jgi:signal transduction histidine kinase/DNA-binding NarL/FixJ family response regulator